MSQESRAKQKAFWTPEQRKLASLRAKAAWTPEKRREASERSKRGWIERRLNDAYWEAIDNGWEFCEWPRWQEQQGPPSHWGNRATRELALTRLRNEAELQRWREKLAQ